MSSNIPHASHVQMAQRLCRIRALLLDMTSETIVCFGRLSKEHRMAASALKKIDELRSVLDSAYHAVTSEEQFKHAGHVYYREWTPPMLSEVTE